MLQTVSSTETIPPTDELACVTRVRELNDKFRRWPTFGGRVVWTPGIDAMDGADKLAIMIAVQKFDAFDDSNDPWREHDFGALEHNGHKIFWKIDYYSRDMKHGSPDPSDPAVTCRVLTIMLASEY